MNKKHLVALTAVVLVLAFILGAYLYRQQQVEQTASLAQQSGAPFVRSYSPVKGSPHAKVTRVEFLDPACETCRAFYPFIQQMLKIYPQQLKVVIRYAPFHHGADYFVKVLEASRQQEMYWETLELMFMTQPQWAIHHQARPELLWPLLEKTNLDLEKLKADMEDPEFQRRIDQDLQDAAALGVTRTPGFFVNNKPLVQFGFDPLKKLIHDEIKRSTGYSGITSR